jgi:hypothetical protein
VTVQIVDNTAGAAPHRPLVHARRSAAALALCGCPPFNPFSDQRVAVTCPACVGEIERRVRERTGTRPRPRATSTAR